MNEIERVARASLIDELALAIDQFLTHQIERDTLACDLTPSELTELATGVAAIAAMRGEPVAWMYSNPSDPLPPSIQAQRHDAMDFIAMRRRGWTETPLYAWPALTRKDEL